MSKTYPLDVCTFISNTHKAAGPVKFKDGYKRPYVKRSLLEELEQDHGQDGLWHDIHSTRES